MSVFPDRSAASWRVTMSVDLEYHNMDKQQAIELIRGSPLSRYADLFIEQLLPSAFIIVDDSSASATERSIGSHFGGLPSLPPQVTWPVWDRRDYLRAQIARLERQFQANPRATGLRDIALRMREELSSDPVPLLFLAELSLAEIGAAAPLPGWPPEGTLLFFYDPSAWGFDPLTRGHSRVFFFLPRESLVKTSPPKAFPKAVKFPQRSLRFQREWTLPSQISRDGVDLAFWADEEYGDLCRQLAPSLGGDKAIHRCGGHPQEIQGDMRLECQLVTNGLYCGDSSGYDDPRRSLLEMGSVDWHLLLQVDSDEEQMGWMWGDTGRVYFWARRQDIESADFEGSWGILQCY